MSGYQFVSAETVSGCELVDAGGLMAAVTKELKAAKIDGPSEISLVRHGGVKGDLSLLVVITLPNGVRMPLLAGPWALCQYQNARAARMIRSRWKEANARCEALADVLARTKPRLESALDRFGGGRD